jgi:hypothetical protein
VAVTLAPLAAKARAIAAPMPLVPPVMKTFLTMSMEPLLGCF